MFVTYIRSLSKFFLRFLFYLSISSLVSREDYDPGSANMKLGEYFTDIQIKELDKPYDTFFKLTPEPKCSLAQNLGIPIWRHKEWMREKHRQQQRIAKAARHPSGTCIEQICAVLESNPQK